MTEAQEKPKNNRSSVHSKCKELDIFGVPVTLVHDGQPMFKTEVGSIFTVLLGICMLSFLVMKLKLFILQDEEQNYNKFIADRNLYDPSESINLKQNNVGFAFGSLNEELPINIARIVPLYIQVTWENGKRHKNTQ